MKCALGWAQHRLRNARPQIPITAKGRFDETSPKFGMPKSGRRSAKRWYKSGCGMRGSMKQIIAIIAARTINNARPTLREIKAYLAEV